MQKITKKFVKNKSRINEYFQGSLIETEKDKWGFNDEKLVN